MQEYRNTIIDTPNTRKQEHSKQNEHMTTETPYTQTTQNKH